MDTSMRVTTKTGDDGTTGLLGGKRVPKDDDTIELVGALDELNSILGMAIAHCVTEAKEHGQGIEPETVSLLQDVQSALFDIGAEVAARGHDDRFRATGLAELVTKLEEHGARYEGTLPELKNFILPGGSRGAASLHVARSACRRAERRFVTWSRSHPHRKEPLVFLNRLSDWLFVLARLANSTAGQTDILWRKR